MNRITLACLVAIAFLSGCAEIDRSPRDTTPPAPNPTSSATHTPRPTETPCVDTPGIPCLPEAPRDIELNDCTVYLNAFPADGEKARNHMADGYSPDAGATGHVAVGLDIYTCKTVVIGNATVLRDVRIAQVGLVTRHPPETDWPDATHIYSLEYITDQPILAAVLAAHSLPVEHGAITVDFDPATGRGSLSVESLSTAYEVSTAGALPAAIDGSGDTSASYRFYGAGPRGVNYYDANYTYSSGQFYEGVVSATKGVLVDILLTPQASPNELAAVNAARASLRFHPLQTETNNEVNP